MPSKRHHYVSKFYLESFASSNSPKRGPLIYVYERGIEAPKWLPLPNAAVQTHYYSVDFGTGEKHDVFEKFLSVIEGNAASVIREQIIAQDAELNDIDRQKLSLYIVMAMLRVPKARDQMHRMVRDVWELIMKNTASTPGALESLNEQLEAKTGKPFDVPAEQLREFLIGDRYKIVVDPVESLKIIFGIAPSLMPMIHFMRWTVLQNDRPEPFLTSDNPVVYVDPTDPGGGYSAVGLANEGLELTFALSPTKCLLASHDPEFRNKIEGAPPEEARRLASTFKPKLRYAKADSVTAREINRRIVHRATKYVFSSSDTPTLRRFISKHMPALAMA